MDILTNFTQKLRRFLASKTFFWLIIGFFVLEAAWIALSAVYPQAFDEDFHFGIIKVYSHHWLPFLASQPPSADPYGAVARDPSFLYHYLMSFPYRLIALFAHSTVVQVILLRIINIGLFTAGLLLFRKVLRRVNLSPLAANVCLFVVALIPVAPQLAGQVNYDNLLMPLTAWACLLAFNALDGIRARRPRLLNLLGLLAVCLVATMVKYEFLPVFFGIVLSLVIYMVRCWRGSWRLAIGKAWQSWRGERWPKQALVLVALLVAGTLFIQRDVGNVVRYHTVVPDCSQVLNIQHCSAYSVWIHDYKSHRAVVDQDAHVNPSPLNYLGEWVYWLWYRLFFAINGTASDFKNYPPLPLPAAAFGLLVLTASAAIIRYGKRVFAGNAYLGTLGVITVVYLLALFAEGYLKYLDTGVLELMNGRYLLPILLLGAAIGYHALRPVLRKIPQLSVWLAAAVMFCFLEGGGVFTFIARSDPGWYWHNATVRQVNHTAQRVLEPVLIDGSKYYSSSKWFFN